MSVSSSQAATTSPAPPPTNPPAYFVDHKRGEVNELKAILRNTKITKDAEKLREAIKKVIAYMTLGIDVSRLFSEMVMAASTKDLVQKKMVYLYLCSYAEQKSDLAIMAINTLQKDCKDEDPMVRGLSLRSLCSLRVPNIVEYAMLPIRARLTDPSPYVRKTAVTGCAKLYRLAPSTIKDSDLVDILYNMLRDKDTQVITNAITALNEILSSEGGMPISQQIVMYLLTRIREFNEWGQCTVLELVAKYTPQSNEQMFDIMNLLEDRLKHSNSAVVLGTTKVFLNFTRNLPKVHTEVYKRLKAPLLTLMTSGSVELSFVVLSHINILVNRAPGVFDDEYKHFFCRYNDPSCVRMLKLTILTNLANDKNMSEVITELSEYVTDVDVEIARKSIQGIGKIAIKIEAAADDAIEHLLSFLSLNMDYVSAEACIMIKDLLRKYPERYEEVIPPMQKCLKTIEETEGKVAVIWMIGEYGDTIPDAPYILESLIDNFDDESSHAVRIELLTATMKLFFKRPPEMQAMLGRLLEKAINDTGKIDVRDRALMYYRLLKYDVQEAARVVNCSKTIVESFVEAEDKDLKDRIFEEFNTLSVIFGLPSEKFLTAKNKELEEEEKGSILAMNTAAVVNSSNGSTTPPLTTNGSASPLHKPDGKETNVNILDNILDFSIIPSSSSSSTSSSSSSPSSTTATATSTSGLASPSSSSSSLSGYIAPIIPLPLNVQAQTSVSASTSPPSLAPSPALKLYTSPTIDPNTFQTKWGLLNVTGNVELKLKSAQLAQDIETSLAKQYIFTMASGTVNNQMKFYFFAHNAAKVENVFLLEAVVDLGTGKLTASIKSDEPNLVPNLIAIFKQSIQHLIQ